MKKILAIIILGAAQFAHVGTVFAASYVPLEKIPGTSQTADLPQYVSAIYKFGIWGIGIAAFLMITIGGFMYMTSAGNNARMNSAKEVISDSLWGLVVAMLAWLLLYIINPDFVSGRLNFRNVPQAAPGVSPGVQYISGSTQEMAQRLMASENISFSAQGDCKDVSGAVVSPRSNIQEAAAGKTITSCSNGCNACNTKVGLSDKLLSALLCVANKNVKFAVSSFAGGRHSNGSMHYLGAAADISNVTPSKQKFVEAMNGCGAYANCDAIGSDGKYHYVDCSQQHNALHVSLNGK